MTLLSIATLLLLDLILRGKNFLSIDFSQDVDDKIALAFTCVSILLGMISIILLFKQWYKQKRIQIYLGSILLSEIVLFVSIVLLIQV
ncbi:MAG: hypothetical protein KUG68_10070 [Flavobacteriaceae bacterium]|nr:hypothetical protein [Flavobacteriaceae bacterium]